MSEKANVTLEDSSQRKLDHHEENDIRKRLSTKKTIVRGHDESVDAKADDFIERFKQQLKLQRLDSLQRLREMLNRGT